MSEYLYLLVELDGQIVPHAEHPYSAINFVHPFKQHKIRQKRDVFSYINIVIFLIGFKDFLLVSFLFQVVVKKIGNIRILKLVENMSKSTELFIKRNTESMLNLLYLNELQLRLGCSGLTHSRKKPSME